MATGLIWLRFETNGRFLQTLQWTFEHQNMRIVSWLFKKLLFFFQEVLRSAVFGNCVLSICPFSSVSVWNVTASASATAPTSKLHYLQLQTKSHVSVVVRKTPVRFRTNHWASRCRAPGPCPWQLASRLVMPHDHNRNSNETRRGHTLYPTLWQN